MQIKKRIKSDEVEHEEDIRFAHKKQSNQSVLEDSQTQNTIRLNNMQTEADISIISVKVWTIKIIVSALLLVFVYWLLCISNILSNEHIEDLTALIQSVFFIAVGYAFNEFAKRK